MKLEVTLSITFAGPPKHLEIHDLEKWARGFRDSVTEFTDDLKRYLEAQPIVQSCQTTTKENS